MVLNKHLEACVLNESEFYPYTFVGERIMCIVFVDNDILWARNEYDIHELEM